MYEILRLQILSDIEMYELKFIKIFNNGIEDYSTRDEGIELLEKIARRKAALSHLNTLIKSKESKENE